MSPERRRSVWGAAGLIVVHGAVACTPSPVRPSVAVPNGGKDPTASAKCHVAASSSSPLVTEWPASEKANLETRLREGGVAVAYTGCSMRLLTQCKLKGAYKWQRTTPATDTLEITNADELYAKLPIGAASLEGELQSSGRLAVQTTVIGQMKLDGLATSDVPTDGDCAGATHVVAGISVGAFKLLAGGSTSAKAGASAMGAGAGVMASSQEILVRQAGDAAACAMAADEQPPAACQSPIQLFLWPLPKKSGAAVAEGDEAPAPDAVRVNFMTVDADVPYQVVEGGKKICDAPCTRWVRKSARVEMERSDGTAGSERLKVDLGKVSLGRDVDAVAISDRSGRWGTGFAMTIVGGFFGAAGLGMTLAGFVTARNDESAKTFQTIGPVVLGVSAGLLGFGIWGLSTGNQGSSVDVTYAPNTTARATWKVGPGYVAGDAVAGAGTRFVLSPFGLSGVF